ncbi:MAG: UbiA family prenyltransferase [Anaerolineales bacterium]
MAGRENAEILPKVIDLLAHLRLHFQLLLAPIFLWGYFLSGVRAPAGFWLGFVSFHIFLYGGITAFNSYYDRDQGPVGGMRVPPPVTEALLPFSLAVLVVGVVLASVVNATFLAIYLAIMAMGLAYSHPGVRLKARPFLGLATVAVGQGLLASLGGWASAEPDLSTMDPIGWLGILGATLVTVGFYPITQSYQVEEDLARGDVTFAAWAGPSRALAFSIGVQALGAAILAITIAQRLGLIQAALVVSFYATLLVLAAVRANEFRQLDVMKQQRRVMVLNTIMSGGFFLFLAANLIVVP